MGDKTINNGYETWKMDEKKCASFCVLNKHGNLCGRCAKIYPWNRPEDFAKWDGSTETLYIGVERQVEQLENNGYCHEIENNRKWWFDFVEIDNILEIPETIREQFVE
jgi:epoxyqueuosine reductase